MDSTASRHGAYVAYMLRLWQTGSRDGLPVWRASLENPHTGERLVFGEGKALLAFLADLMDELVDVKDSADKSDLAEGLCDRPPLT